MKMLTLSIYIYIQVPLNPINACIVIKTTSFTLPVKQSKSVKQNLISELLGFEYWRVLESVCCPRVWSRNKNVVDIDDRASLTHYYEVFTNNKDYKTRQAYSFDNTTLDPPWLSVYSVCMSPACVCLRIT